MLSGFCFCSFLQNSEHFTYSWGFLNNCHCEWDISFRRLRAGGAGGDLGGALGAPRHFHGGDGGGAGDGGAFGSGGDGDIGGAGAKPASP